MLTALTGLQAQSLAMAVSANNVANVETDGFKKSRVLFREALPSGVSVAVEKDERPGTIVTGAFPEDGERELSNVNLHEEIVRLITTGYAYKAGVVTVRTAYEMEEKLMDILA